MAPPGLLFQGKFSGGGVIRDHCEQWMLKSGKKCGTRALGLKRWTFVNMLVRFLNVFLLLLRFPFFLVSTVSKVHPGWVITDCRSLLWMILILRLVLMHALTIWGRTY